jgi:hypothetical protein
MPSIEWIYGTTAVRYTLLHNVGNRLALMKHESKAWVGTVVKCYNQPSQNRLASGEPFQLVCAIVEARNRLRDTF